MPPETEPRTAATTSDPADRDANSTPAIDLDLLCELVYQRWLDELRRERERGGWD
jgi:hypothetical protein